MLATVFIMTENNFNYIKFIEERKQQLRELQEFWRDFKDQNEHLSFDSNAFQHIQSKVSSKMAFLQKSINDHQKFV